MVKGHPELDSITWLSEFTKGWHKHKCGKCHANIHPWEDNCPKCGNWINWEAEYTPEVLEEIRKEHLRNIKG